jgi:hypothetical protein
MTKWKLHLIQVVVWLLIFQGIASIWEYTDILVYGESQRSAVDAIAAIFMTEWLHNKIWRTDND